MKVRQLSCSQSFSLSECKTNWASDWNDSINLQYILMFFVDLSQILPAYLAESEFDVRKLLLKSLVHVFLQIRWFDVFYYCCLDDKRWEEKI